MRSTHALRLSLLAALALGPVRLAAASPADPAATPSDKAPPADKAPAPDKSMTVRWDNGVWIESASKAFRLHLGGRTQIDGAWSWAEDHVSRSGPGNIGPFNDAVNFRRARLEIDGWMYDVVDFFFEYDFLNTFDTGKMVDAGDDFGGRVANVPVPTDLWVSINHLPGIRTLRVGNMKAPIGLEHLTSSRFLPFLERSFQFDAFLENGNNGFSPGLQILTWTEDERLSFQLGAFSNARSIFGWNVGNNEWTYAARATWLPYYEDGGRNLLHVGLGAAFDNLDDGNTRFRARSLVRNGPAALHNVVAVARLDGESQVRVNPELLLNLGPFALQSEYIAVVVNDVSRILQTPTQSNLTLTPRTVFMQGAYAEMMFFLTGENLSYGKTGLHGSGASTGRVTPKNNYFVSTKASDAPAGWGAWQLAVRYSYLDLNDSGVVGGRLHDVTGGLNWFLNPNVKLQANYSHGWRSIPASPASGRFQQLGVTLRADI